MSRMLILVALTMPAIVAAQGNTGTYNDFVFQSNLPDEIFHFYTQAKIQTAYAIRKDLNPFYLRGDFNGDQKPDCALAIVDRKTGKKGMLIYHTDTGAYFVVGAGKVLPNGNGGDDYSWMEAWKVHPDQEVSTGAGETEKLTLRGEGILAIKLESASGIIYWTGKEYRWYQQGD